MSNKSGSLTASWSNIGTGAVNANSFKSLTGTVATVSGYTCIGIVGITSYQAPSIIITSYSVSGSSYSVEVQNSTATRITLAASDVSIKCLYYKN